MARRPLRLLHASDLHLDRPVHGLPHVPEHLRETVRDAPRLAAEQVFELALAENVDAVLLAGDVIDTLRADPRSLVFLAEQFRRLEARGVPVFWAGGLVDRPEHWPRTAPLPANVTVFPVGRVAQHDVREKDEILCRIQGTSAREGGLVDTSGFHRDAHGRQIGEGGRIARLARAQVLDQRRHGGGAGRDLLARHADPFAHPCEIEHLHRRQPSIRRRWATPREK